MVKRKSTNPSQKAVEKIIHEMATKSQASANRFPRRAMRESFPVLFCAMVKDPSAEHGFVIKHIHHVQKCYDAGETFAILNRNYQCENASYLLAVEHNIEFVHPLLSVVKQFVLTNERDKEMLGVFCPPDSMDFEFGDLHLHKTLQIEQLRPLMQEGYLGRPYPYAFIFDPRINHWFGLDLDGQRFFWQE